MSNCSICKEIEVMPGRLSDYKKLACYHYREAPRAGPQGAGLGPFAAIYALRLTGRLKWRADTDCAGVVVYKMPDPNVELRNAATAGLFAGLDRDTQLALVNSNIRRIARVVVDPMFRGLGLASRLVRETMPLMNVPIIEALAVMGLVNPFFEKAGMQGYAAKMPVRSVRLIEALSSVGILASAERTAAGEDRCLINPRKVQDAIDRLDEDAGKFIEREIGLFLQSYGSRRKMSPGFDRTKYILSKLTDRPAYYIWFNPNMELRI
ncbi:MAG TPA: hypothetical protein VJJ98_11675 [Sedimentisphaerales bacterium]|nr:hypothetical protein [Sedimentisphaerales bacterium]